MSKTILLGPQQYEIHMAGAVATLESHGYICIPNPGTKALDPAHIARHAESCVAVIAGLERWDAERMDLLPNLRLLIKCGVGLDSIDLAAARQRNIRVTNTPGLNSNAVAELTVGLIIALLRGLYPALQALRNGNRIQVAGHELAGRCVGIVGWGDIGQLVARRLRGFDVEIRVFDPFIDASTVGVRRVNTLAELVGNSDIVSLHIPATPQTSNMVNAELLSIFRPGAFLINTARGALIDEGALLNALDRGHLSGAALDVFHDEDGVAPSPLLGRSDILVTPHLAAETIEAYRAVGAANAEDVIDGLAARPLKREIR